MTNQYSRHKRMNNPWFLLLMIGAGVFVAKLWRDDFRRAQKGEAAPGGLPGATFAPQRAMVIAVVGALVILAGETLGEFALGLAEEQTRMTALFALYSIVAAPVIEEIIFRGWLVVEHRGRATLWLGAIGASFVFALLHPFLWRWDEGGFAFTFTAKGWFSTAVLFATSLWLYIARFARWNPHASLIPCFAAHAAKNAGVVAIKAASGYVSGWW